MLHLLFRLVISLHIEPLPNQLTPPTPRRMASSIHSDIDNSAYLYGGGSQFGEPYSDQLWKFSLDDFTWEQVNLNTPIFPEGRIGCAMATHEEFIYVYGGSCDHGPSADFWLYNIKEAVWTEHEIKGDKPGPIAHPAYSNFEYEGVSYMAMFGGFNSEKATNDLYLLDLENETWTYLNSSTPKPMARIGARMEFYNDCLYLWGASQDGDEEENLKLYRYSLEENSWSVIETNIIEDMDSRSFHGVYCWDGYFYVFYGVNMQDAIEFNSVLMVPVAGGNWTELELNFKITIGMFATVLNEESVWIFCGGDTEGEYNSVYQINLTSKSIKEFFPNTYIFHRRHSYTLFRIGTDLLLFGGADSENVYDDLYKYNLMTLQWQSVVASGDPPSARYGHCASGYQGLYLIIFGGRDFDTEFNDMFQYNLRTNTWSTIVPHPEPAPRYGCCMTTHEKFILIQGGQTPSKVTNEIITIDLHNHELTIVDNFDLYEKELSIRNHKCWSRHTLDGQKLELLVATGENLYGQVLKHVFMITFDIDNKINEAAVESVVYLNESQSWASAGVIAMSNTFLVIGGTKRAMYASNQIFSISSRKSSDEVTQLEIFYEENGTAYWYNHDVEHYMRNIYVGFSGAYYANMIKEHTILSHLYKIHPSDIINDTSDFKYIECSAGTYGENCDPCSPGTYKEDVGPDDCQKCPIGTYNPYNSSISIESCFPCKFGFFANETGMENCLHCEPNKYCPVGSNKPSFRYYRDDILSHQPVNYASNISDPFDGKVYYFVYLTGSMLFLVYIFNPTFRYKLSRIDYFSEKHETKVGHPVVKMRTSLGGLFTIIFTVFQVIYISQAFNNYRYDNILETKALVPAIIRDEVFEADEFIVKTELFYYPGYCTQPNPTTKEEKYECTEYLYETYEDIDGETKCNKNNETDTCELTFTCENCHLTGDSSIKYKLCEYGSLASGIKVTVKSPSSIPGEHSEEVYILEYYNGTVLRGDTSSEFFFEVTRSVFESDSSDWATGTTGYHIGRMGEPNPGDRLTGDDISFEPCVSLKIYLNMNGSVLVTRRIFKLAFMLMITTSIASVFGILEMFGLAMIMSEKAENCFKKKVKSIKDLSSVINARGYICRSFEYENYEKVNNKKAKSSFARSTYTTVSHKVTPTLYSSPGVIAETTQNIDLDS